MEFNFLFFIIRISASLIFLIRNCIVWFRDSLQKNSAIVDGATLMYKTARKKFLVCRYNNRNTYCLVLMGPLSSIGSPMTFMILPKVSGPTGILIDVPESRTFWPLTMFPYPWQWSLLFSHSKTGPSPKPAWSPCLALPGI